METLLIALIAVLLSALCVGFLAEPFFKSIGAETDEAPVRLASLCGRSAHDNLRWEKNIALQTIKELEMDFQMGKISEEDWSAQRVVLIEKVANLISALKQERKSLDEEIEAEIKKVRTCIAKKGETEK